MSFNNIEMCEHCPMSVDGVVDSKDITNLFMEHFKVEIPEHHDVRWVRSACNPSMPLVLFTVTDDDEMPAEVAWA